MMSGPVITTTLPPSPQPATNDSAKARDAAQQFEALLLAEILRSARESGGFGKTGESGECATDFAEQQLARVLAQHGGLGLAPLIASGLQPKPASPAATGAAR